MPLTKSLRHIKGNFIREYGHKRGEKFFYGWERKHYPNLFSNGGKYASK